MGEDDPTFASVDYQVPGTPRPLPRYPKTWGIVVAYILLVLPAVYANVGDTSYPPDDRTVMSMRVLGAAALAGGLFLVRRQPRNLLAWMGLAFYSLLAVAGMAGALVTALRR